VVQGVLSSSLEHYLETIWILESQNGSARSKEIAELLNVKRSSVTAAIKILSERGLVVYESYRPIVLTDRGQEIAYKILHKKQILKDFFQDILKIPEDKATEIACASEHVLDTKAAEQLQRFMRFVQSCDCNLSNNWEQRVDCLHGPEMINYTCPGTCKL